MKDLDLRKLQTKFPLKDIEWRIQSTKTYNNIIKCIIVPYLTNRSIQQRLDDVVGAENWKNEYRETVCEKYEFDKKTNQTVLKKVYGFLCGISIFINGQWVTKWDGASNTDIEPIKGGISDSMKRSAVQWGMGRQLYEFPRVYADISKEYQQGYEWCNKEGGFWWQVPAIFRIEKDLSKIITELKSFYDLLNEEQKANCNCYIENKDEQKILDSIKYAKKIKNDVDNGL